MALLDEVLDDEMSASLRADIEAHLDGCEHCFITMNTTRRTIEFYANRELYPMPEAIRVRLQEAILDKCRKC
jgi:anti-sigma factor RsiW